LNQDLIDWREAKPGETVVLSPWTRLESICADKDFNVGDEMMYSLCVGRVASTTASGLTTIKVYLLTPLGVGYRRFNLVGYERNQEKKRLTRTWT